MLKVLYILPSLGKGGAERYVIDLCLELNRRSDIVYKLVLLESINKYEYLTKEIPYIQLNAVFTPSITKKTNFNNFEYRKLVDDFKPDIIHTHLFQAEIFSTVYLPDNISYVVHCHDSMKQFRNFRLKYLFQKELITNYFEKIFLIRKKYRKRNTYFITNSTVTHKYFLKNLPKFLQTNIKFIEYGFDFNRFNNLKNDIVSFDKIRLINVGRFTTFKNQQFLIKICKLLRNKNIQFEMNLLGDGQEFDNIQKMVNEYDLNDCVFLRGNIDLVEDWLKNSDIYIHSAYYEPFGLVLLEAMASGLPCVILNGQGNADIIQHGLNGYIFDIEDENLFVEKILDLKNDIDKYVSISKNARKFSAKFGIEEKTNELLAFYNSIK